MWWEVRKEWRLMVRAECHHRSVRRSTVKCKGQFRITIDKLNITDVNGLKLIQNRLLKAFWSFGKLHVEL